MALTRSEERQVMREAATEVALLSAAWRDDMNKRKQDLDTKYGNAIVAARNDALQAKVLILAQRDVNPSFEPEE